MKKILGSIFIAILFFLLGFLLFFFVSFHRSTPKVDGNVVVKGLASEVRIITDNWGVPHIFATNEKDLFFSCGFIHAQERMWQMEIARRSGTGRLSEIFGQVTLDRDKALRNLGLKEAAYKDLEKLTPKMKTLLLAYSMGVNSWMNSRKYNWPPEFMIMRCRPEPWKTIDTLLIKEVMALLLCADYPSEVVRANLIKRLGAQKALQILEEDLDIFPSETIDASLSPWLKTFFLGGSNSWVVSSSRTVSGKPLLANDPHLEISLPPIWYEIHLNCPSINVSGASIPGLPLVVIGHNESMAWGITNSAVDVQDLYIEKLNSTKDMVKRQDGWVPLVKKVEEILVRGKKLPAAVDIYWTDHGPIISPMIIKSKAPLSLRWTLYDGGRTFEAFYLINKAQNWNEFKGAMELFDTPSHNFVYADTKGNIGYYLGGRIPLRKKEAALFPFPGWMEEGTWKGFLEEDKKPIIFNPEEGFIITANNKIVPDNFPHYISIDYDVSIRAERIKELLLRNEKHDMQSFQKIQNDVFSKKGEFFLSILRQMEGYGGSSGKALDILESWNLQMESGNSPALYEVFMNLLPEETFSDELGEDFLSFNFLFRRKQSGLLRIFSDPLSEWFDNKNTDIKETRDDIINITLERAYDWLGQHFGRSSGWDWEKIHSIQFQHILGQSPFLKFFNRGDFPVQGDAFTVNATYSLGYGTTHGASYRQIIDLSDWKKSVSVLSSGQSGHIQSRFYDDQIPLWLNGKYHPMLFFLDDIEDHARGTLILYNGN